MPGSFSGVGDCFWGAIATGGAATGVGRVAEITGRGGIGFAGWAETVGMGLLMGEDCEEFVCAVVARSAGRSNRGDWAAFNSEDFACDDAADAFFENI